MRVKKGEIEKSKGKFRAKENEDFIINDKGEIEPIKKIRNVFRPLYKPETPVVLNEQGGVIAPAMPGRYEMIEVTEEYTEEIPTVFEIKRAVGSTSRSKCIYCMDVLVGFMEGLLPSLAESHLKLVEKLVIKLQHSYIQEALKELKKIEVEENIFPDSLKIGLIKKLEE